MTYIFTPFGGLKDCPLELGQVEIVGILPGTEVFAAQVDCICAVSDGSKKCFPAASRC